MAEKSKEGYSKQTEAKPQQKTERQRRSVRIFVSLAQSIGSQNRNKF